MRRNRCRVPPHARSSYLQVRLGIFPRNLICLGETSLQLATQGRVRIGSGRIEDLPTQLVHLLMLSTGQLELSAIENDTGDFARLRPPKVLLLVVTQSVPVDSLLDLPEQSISGSAP